MTYSTTARRRSAAVTAAALAATALGSVALAVPADAATAGADGDKFAAPIVITGFADDAFGTNFESTAEPGEPSHAKTPSGAADLADHSIWFKWKSPVNGHVTFRTRDSDIDTVMAAYTGATVSTLTQLASDDDTDMVEFGGTIGHTQSQINFAAVKNVTYMIAVDSFTGSLPADQVETGDIALSWNANDDFSGAQTITGPNGTITSAIGGDTTGATKETGEPLHAGKSGAHSIWYSWKAPNSGTVTFDTAPSDFDTLLAAYTGSSVGALTQIAANDDVGLGDNTSKITFSAVSGKTYKIAVDGFSTGEGISVLQYRFAS